jgi:hypothetical protein
MWAALMVFAQVLANFERELQKANSHSFKHLFLSIFVA